MCVRAFGQRAGRVYRVERASTSGPRTAKILFDYNRPCSLPTGGYGWAPVDLPSALTWVPCNSGDPLPRGAVHVGMDKGGDRLYVGRAFHEGDLLPAKVNPSHSSAYVCWGGLEHAMSHYEVRSIVVTGFEIGRVPIEP